jgi:3-dehydrotetronate 4-kinase
LHFGAIADDFTGATDLALMLRAQGWRVSLQVGVPGRDAAFGTADAVVVALKSRTIDPKIAVDWSVATAKRLRAAGAAQLFFKYCSTFDSTDAGNIGPVADALLALTGADFTIACPAFPANGRTIYKGHLFVGDRLLSESPMKDHPLTPMRDPDLVRVLGRQTTRKVGLVEFAAVSKGAAAIRAAFDDLKRKGAAYAIVDALTDADLRAIGAACKDMALVTGGSGVTMGLPASFGAGGAAPKAFAAPKGGEAIFAGSCSLATRGQVARFLASGGSALKIDPAKLPSRADVAAWMRAQAPGKPFLVYSTAEPDSVRAAQAVDPGISAKLESILAHAAVDAAAQGRTRIVAAGGETSGAVVEALGVATLEIGVEICPGVPWTLDARWGLALALKSGNFGGENFFADAFGALA